MATSLLFDSAPPMAKPSVKLVKPSAKQKQGRPTGSKKQAQEWDIGRWGFSFSVLVTLEGFFTNFVNFGRETYSASSSNFVSFRKDIYSASSSNSLGFGRDARSASSFNSTDFYLWAADHYCARHQRAVYCHCALYLWAAYYHRSFGFPPQSFIELTCFSSDWSLGFPLRFPLGLGDFSSTMLY